MPGAAGQCDLFHSPVALFSANRSAGRHLIQEKTVLNADLKAQLARIFGLSGSAQVDALVARLRAGGNVDADALRAGFLALADAADQERGAGSSEQRLKVALEAANLGFWDWDLTTGEVFVDRAFCKFLGREEQDQVWTLAYIASLVHPDDHAAFDAAARDALRGSLPLLELNQRIMHADGRWVWIETHGNVTARDAAGRATRMMGTHADITDRKQLERALSNTLRVMQALLETLPLPVIIRDAERHVTLINAAWEQMMGIPRHEVLGKRLDSHHKHAHSKTHRVTDDEVMVTKKSLRYEIVVFVVDGT